MVSRQQALKDFDYLRENVDYAIDEDILVNYIVGELQEGRMNNAQFVAWCIKDLWQYVYSECTDDEIEFLETDKRALRIKERYNIDINYDRRKQSE